MGRPKIIAKSVNKGKPKVEFFLWHSDEKGYCPAANKEIIGIVNTRKIIKKVLGLKIEHINILLDKIQDENKILIFGKDVAAHLEDKMVKHANVFYLGKVE